MAGYKLSYRGADIDNAIGKALSSEQTTNKVTSISSSSTNTQYPSAKAVYDALRTGNQIFTNVSADTWEYDETYSDFQYSCTISISGITSSMTAQVVFPLDLAMTGYYAPICETGEGYIKIFSMTDSSITLNSITVWSE